MSAKQSAFTMKTGLLLSCEHASNAVPPEWQHLFIHNVEDNTVPMAEMLASHRGYDPLALDAARLLATRWQLPLFAGSATRLLCELNRSEKNRGIWSAWTRALRHEEKESILNACHRPHWQAVRAEALRLLQAHNQVLHIAVHSFTPIWKGQPRMVDVGLLFDPARADEATLARALQPKLTAALKDAGLPCRVRRNNPYLGVSNSLPQQLRRELGPGYLGFEIEASQGNAYPAKELAKSLEQVL